MKLRYVISFAIVLTLLFIQKGHFVSAVSQSEINSKNAQIRQLERQIQDIQNRKNQTAQQKSSKEAEVNNLKQQINNLNSDIKKLQGQIVEVGQKINETDNNIKETTQNIQELESQIASNKATIKSLVESLYKSSLVRNEVVAVVSADQLSDVFSDIEYSNTIQMRIQTLLDEIIEKKTALDATNQNLVNQKATLASTQGALQSTKESIENSKNSVQNKAKASEIAANQLGASLSSLSSKEQELEKLRSQVARELASIQATQRIVSSKSPLGSIIWPAQAQYCSQGYGMTTYAKTGAYNGQGHNGIDISGSGQVYSVQSGIVYAKSTGRACDNNGLKGNDSRCNGGWGNWVAILHDSGHVTLYAHLLGHSPVAQGSRVSQGQAIGSIGNSGLSTGYHLHFSIYRSFGLSASGIPAYSYSQTLNPESYYNVRCWR
jgi:murein DD-endopeptidase MepM/ murein hydrolase activator NlpD